MAMNHFIRSDRQQKMPVIFDVHTIRSVGGELHGITQEDIENQKNIIITEQDNRFRSHKIVEFYEVGPHMYAIDDAGTAYTNSELLANQLRDRQVAQYVLDAKSRVDLQAAWQVKDLDFSNMYTRVGGGEWQRASLEDAINLVSKYQHDPNVTVDLTIGATMTRQYPITSDQQQISGLYRFDDVKLLISDPDLGFLLHNEQFILTDRDIGSELQRIEEFQNTLQPQMQKSVLEQTYDRCFDENLMFVSISDMGPASLCRYIGPNINDWEYCTPQDLQVGDRISFTMDVKLTDMKKGLDAFEYWHGHAGTVEDVIRDENGNVSIVTPAAAIVFDNPEHIYEQAQQLGLDGLNDVAHQIDNQEHSHAQ